MDDRLRKAKKYLSIAESKDSKREAFKAAAIEVVAYKKEHPRASNVSIAIEMGRDGKAGGDYLGRLIKWHGTGFKAETPFLMDEQATARAAMSHTKAVLANAPMEQVEKIIAGLPEKRQQQIAAAAGDEYAQMRERFDDKQPKNEAERKARDAQADSFAKEQTRVARSFAAMGIAVHIEQAVDDLREAIETEAVTVELLVEIEKQADLLATEIEVARGMVGLQARR